MVSRWSIPLSTVLCFSSLLLFGQSPDQVAESKTTPAPAESTPAVPSKPLTSEQRGDILIARKMYREAIEMYNQQQPDTAVLRNKIGIAYHQLLQIDIAKKYYEQSVRMEPKYAEALNNLGTVYQARKNYRRAITQYRRALRQSPESASIYSNLGTAYFARKNYKEAAEMYQKALALDPEVFEKRSNFGVILQERNVEERAKFHYYLAKTYAKAGQTERALQYIRKALEEGFAERKKMMEEPAFTAMRELPEFKELMASQPRVL